MGLEQEFFLVDGSGALSDRADDLLGRCRELAKRAGRNPEGFAPECAPCMVEINTPPVGSFPELAREYTAALKLALAAARDLGLRLYPLATYPLDGFPPMRDDPRYELQARTVGRERFGNAGRCAGVHLHLEAPEGTVDRRVGVSYAAPEPAREELLSLYNLATALDAALISLGRSCPFHAGEAPGLATRTACYRGDPDLFPDGLYAELPAVGGLRPYARTVEELVELQFARYRAWLEAMDRAGVDRRLYHDTGDGMLEASWNPVRLNPVGTIELRGIDGNHPRTVLALAALVKAAADRVRREGLKVVPGDGLRVFEAGDDALYVPDFASLGGELFRAAVREGAGSPEVSAYLDSVFEFVHPGEDAGLTAELRDGDGYRTTEENILSRFPATPELPRAAGLELVLEACDELEAQVSALGSGAPGGAGGAGKGGEAVEIAGAGNGGD